MTYHIDNEFERDLMLPVEDLLDLQGNIMPGAIHPQYRDDAERLLSIVSRVADISPTHGRRIRQAVQARTIVAYCLYRKGMGLSEIGRLLGKEHSTAYHYIRTMEFALEHPRQFSELIYIWKKVTEEIAL